MVQSTQTYRSTGCRTGNGCFTKTFTFASLISTTMVLLVPSAVCAEMQKYTARPRVHATAFAGLFQPVGYNSCNGLRACKLTSLQSVVGAFSKPTTIPKAFAFERLPLRQRARSMRTVALAGDGAVSAGNEAATEDDAEAIDVTAAVDSELARIEAILASGGPESDGINKALAKIDKRSAATCTAGKLEKAIKKKSGAFSTLVEFCVEEGSKRDVEDVSRACRMGKAAAIVVDVGFSLAGHDRDTMLTVVSEQTKSKGNFPGPCPIVLRHCALVAAEQVAEASVLGVNALMLPSAAVLSDGATVLSAASALGLEVVVEVDDQESVSAALDAGARIICIRGVGSLEEALELRKTVPQEVAVLAAIPAQQEDDAELGDVAEAKGAAFDGVVLMEAVIEAQNDLEYCIYMLPAIQSKKSSTFAFAAIGTQEGLGQDGKMMPAAEEAMKRNPRAWQKAQREAKQIVGDYKRGVRSLGGDKGSKL